MADDKFDAEEGMDHYAELAMEAGSEGNMDMNKKRTTRGVACCSPAVLQS